LPYVTNITCPGRDDTAFPPRRRNIIQPYAIEVRKQEADVTDIRRAYRPKPLKEILFYVFGAAVVCALIFYLVSLTILPQETSNLAPPVLTSRLR
jgi:hypothetical protein